MITEVKPGFFCVDFLRESRFNANSRFKPQRGKVFRRHNIYDIAF